MKSLKFLSQSPDETLETGRWLGEFAKPGDIFLLVGQLGAGKTCLTQGIAHGLGIDEYALSPSFVLMREMHGRLPLYHMDFYRLDTIAEISDLGLDDYLYGRGVCVIEWAEKGMEVLPEDHLLARITYISENRRSFEFTATGERYENLLTELHGALKASQKD
jgi:tRNA threonylcarbamoyladenosine biosynthesis protein TsaE